MAKSVTYKLKVKNVENPETPHEVFVQVNRRGGVCNITPRVGDIFNEVQGRPFELAYGHIMFRLSEVLNNK